MSNDGKRVKVHYIGTFDDGTKFDSSYDRGEPLEFICNAGMMIKGFDAAVLEMEKGQTVNIHLTADEAYGPVDPSKIRTFDIAALPGSEHLEVGQQVMLGNQYTQMRATVTAKDEKTITLDTNPEMAGKELNFEITLVEVE